MLSLLTELKCSGGKQFSYVPSRYGSQLPPYWTLCASEMEINIMGPFEESHNGWHSPFVTTFEHITLIGHILIFLSTYHNFWTKLQPFISEYAGTRSNSLCTYILEVLGSISNWAPSFLSYHALRRSHSVPLVKQPGSSTVMSPPRRFKCFPIIHSTLLLHL